MLGWLWLGSLPLLAVYLWISDRINSLAVPVVFGLVGLLLTVALTGQELAQPWRRDLIPWILPYAAAEHAIHTGVAQQEAHLAGTLFQPEPNVIRLPSGRKIQLGRTSQTKCFSHLPHQPRPGCWPLSALLAGALILGLGCADAGRNRA